MLISFLKLTPKQCSNLLAARAPLWLKFCSSEQVTEENKLLIILNEYSDDDKIDHQKFNRF